MGKLQAIAPADLKYSITCSRTAAGDGIQLIGMIVKTRPLLLFLSIFRPTAHFTQHCLIYTHDWDAANKSHRDIRLCSWQSTHGLSVPHCSGWVVLTAVMQLNPLHQKTYWAFTARIDSLMSYLLTGMFYYKHA